MKYNESSQMLKNVAQKLSVELKKKLELNLYFIRHSRTSTLESKI